MFFAFVPYVALYASLALMPVAQAWAKASCLRFASLGIVKFTRCREFGSFGFGSLGSYNFVWNVWSY